MSTAINRRSFIAAAGAAAAGTALVSGASLSTATAAEAPASSWRVAPDPVDESLITAEYAADFLIIGLGYAGCNAAHTLTEAGADVIGIDYQSEENFMVTAMDYGHINSQFLADHGVPKADPIEFFNNWMLQSLNIANPDLIRQYTNNCGDACDWYLSYLDPAWVEENVSTDYWPDDNGMLLSEVNNQHFYVGTAQFHNRNMSDAHRVHLKAIVDEGGTIHYDTRAQYLIKDGDRVIGCVAKNGDGEYVRYLGNKAVCLCTGDFGTNEEMREELLPQIADTVNSPDEWFSDGRSGDGHKMGVWAGGRLEPRPLPAMELPYQPFAPFMPMNALWLDYQGKRFCNEFFGDSAWNGRALVNMHREAIYTLNDSKVTEQLYSIPSHCRFDPSEEGSIAGLQDLMDQAVAAGAEGVEHPMGQFAFTYYAANDLETLADYAGLTGEAKENLVASVTRYNELCEKGVDEDYGKDSRLMFPISEPPYFISVQPIHCIGNYGVTVGGFLTTGDQQVLDQNYDPIPGLYASGNTCGRRFGYNYFTPCAGVSCGIANTLGRVLGQHLLTL